MDQEQIKQKAEEYAGKYPNAWDDVERKCTKDGYIAGANMILESEEYKRMESDAEKWKTLKEKVDKISNETNDPMSFHLSVGEVVTELIGK